MRSDSMVIKSPGQADKEKNDILSLDFLSLWLSIASLTIVAQTVKNLPAMREAGFDPGVGKIPWRREWQPT